MADETPSNGGTAADTPSTGTQPQAAPTGGGAHGASPAGEAMTREQAAARIEELKADPGFRKMLLGEANLIGTRNARAEWDRLHKTAYGNDQAEGQAGTETPTPYKVNSQIIRQGAPLLGWMRAAGADQGLVDGVVKLTEDVVRKGTPSPEDIRAQGAQAIDNLQRKYGPEAARKMVDKAHALIERIPSPQREAFKAFLDETGLGSHPYMVERFALLAARRN